MAFLPGNARSKHSYCGARIWADFSQKGALAERLFEYWGTFPHDGRLYHKWRPYRRAGHGLLLTDDQIMKTIDVFKPLVIDCEELGPFEKEI